ncbi:uncharacterized protein LOC130451331 [Diorhabda sublineata]|uniref:uncharacterized protein LOC130451331 n=1 Tax=Diorhabda sublineata TaxID=1163346 RepID=UPI0024E0E786|nr:uncharacterized protein LOC130451331 [Diorhabda sublineata]
MRKIVFIIAVITSFFFTVHPRNSKSRRFISNRTYLPRCKFDENIFRSNELFAQKIKEAEVVFTGKVTSEVVIINNSTVLFSVIVRRYFKNNVGLSKNKEVRIVKPLKEGEGVKCRQPLRVKYTAIFVGRKYLRAQDVDVILAVPPIPVTLNNLDRVSAATKGMDL